MTTLRLDRLAALEGLGRILLRTEEARLPPRISRERTGRNPAERERRTS
jgi:hypothetical protein